MLPQPQPTKNMADQPSQDHQRKRLTFDPTINAGHLLTFLGLLAAGVIGWNTLDKRVVVLEEAKTYQRERDQAQDSSIAEKLGDIKETLREVKRGVDDLKQRTKP